MHGYDRYEVSNYARPNAECRHNLAYWRQDQWLAAGPSASGHVAGWRWKNVPRLDSYLGAPGDRGLPPAIDVEAPDARRAMAERIMTGLRLREGIDAASLPDKLHAEAHRQRDGGNLVIDGDRWRLTDQGMMLADGIAAELMSLL